MMNTIKLSLPITQRVLLILHDIEGMSIPESAGILNIAVNIAKTRLHCGRAALSLRIAFKNI